MTTNTNNANASTNYQAFELELTNDYRVMAELNNTDSLLLTFSQNGEESWGLVLNNWRTPTQENIVGELGARPSGHRELLTEALQKAREYSGYIPIVP